MTENLSVDVFLTGLQDHSPFDLILMDCSIPVMDGFQMTKLLKEKVEIGEVRRTFEMTVNVSLADKQKCLRSGMDYFISKPFSKLDLLNQIKQALSERK